LRTVSSGNTTTKRRSAGSRLMHSSILRGWSLGVRVASRRTAVHTRLDPLRALALSSSRLLGSTSPSAYVAPLPNTFALCLVSLAARAIRWPRPGSCCSAFTGTAVALLRHGPRPLFRSTCCSRGASA
jgi:hypothetical protein